MSGAPPHRARPHSGGGGKRGRDGDDGRPRRPPDKTKPIDKLTKVDLEEGGRLRVIYYALIAMGTLGTPPRGQLLTVTKNRKPLHERTQAVATWLDGLERCPSFAKSELSQAFVHVVRAVRASGLYDHFVDTLVEHLTDRALGDDAGPTPVEDPFGELSE